MEDIERADWWTKEKPEPKIVKHLKDYFSGDKPYFLFQPEYIPFSDRMVALGLILFSKKNG